jgi:Zn-dependent peptidase ImmA (M78 family)
MGAHPTINQVFDWVRTQFQFQAECPEIWMVDHEHMQDAATRGNHCSEIRGQVFGWYSHNFPNKVFLSDQANPSHKLGQTILAHELTHYLQYVTPKYEDMKPFQPSNVEMLETEANRLMVRFLNAR